MDKCIKILPNSKQFNLDWLLKELKALGYSKYTIHSASLILEELLVNIINYSGTQNPIILNLTYLENEIKIRIADEGVKFNPLEDFEPDLGCSIENKRVGGLGIHLVKSLSKNITYNRNNKFNILSLEINSELSKGSLFKTRVNDIANNTIDLIQNNNLITA